MQILGLMLNRLQDSEDQVELRAKIREELLLYLQDFPIRDPVSLTYLKKKKESLCGHMPHKNVQKQHCYNVHLHHINLSGSVQTIEISNIYFFTPTFFNPSKY